MSDFDEIVAFVAMAKSGGLAAAEAQTGLPRSSLSRRLSALERRLGVQLAKRSPQGFTLTETGAALFAEYAAGLDRIIDAEAVALTTQVEPSGVVRMTAPSPIVHGFLTEELPGLFARHPEIWVSVVTESAKLDLAAESFDLAIRVGDVQGDSQVARQLFEECDAFYASPSYLARHELPCEPDDLGRHDVITCQRAVPTARSETWPMTTGFRDAAPRIQVRLHVGDIMSALAATEAGIGIGRLPRFIGQAAARAGRLTRVLSDWTGPAKPVRAILPNKPSAATRAVLAYLADAAKVRWR